MENYFRLNMEPNEINAISNLGLAHIGAAVFEPGLSVLPGRQTGG